jgi:NAD(P)-dependent dehydrogenase (short-subunit alcohol dehydrogenase family)
MSKPILVYPSSVVLVSGGARGITAECVIKLAERANCKFILLGRSSVIELPPYARNGYQEADLKRLIMEDLLASGSKPLPTKVNSVFRSIQASKEIMRTLEAVRQAGGQAEYLNVDITDAPALTEGIAEATTRLGAVTGIIHGAGSLADKLIEKKTEQDFESVYSPKITGLENILACVPVTQLDFLVLFSSIVGFYGNVGQSDYAIANEILNKSAHRIKNQYPNLHVISIDWGPWEAGMVTPELKRMFEERNIQLIPVEVGARMLVDELVPNSSQGPVQVVVGQAPAYPTGEVDTNLRQYQIRRVLKLESNPFLYDHRIGDRAVLPATCAAAWVLNTCEQLYPGYSFFSMQQFRVLKGIVFDDSLASEHVLDLVEISKSEDGEVTFEAKVWSQNEQGRTFYHYSLQVKLVRNMPEAPVEALPKVDRQKIILGQSLYQNGTLFHGPSFQGVQRVQHVGPDRLVMQVSLPKVRENVQGQFPVQNGNPYVYDAIVQCLLIWSQEFYQAPCLPSRLEQFTQYHPIPFEQTVHVSMKVAAQSETSVIGDITVQDAEGRVYVRIMGLEGTISRQLGRFIGARPGSQLPAF